MSSPPTTAPDAVLDTVRELAPRIAARAGEIETARRLPRDLLDELISAGCSGCCSRRATTVWALTCPARCGSTRRSPGPTPPPAVLAVRRPGVRRALRRDAPVLVLYGALAMAGVQGAFFNAVRYLPVPVALLLVYTSPVLVIVWGGWRGGGRRG